MNSQLNSTSDGTEPPPEQQRWWDVSYRWFGWIGGLPLLAGGLLGLFSDFGSRRLGPSLFFLGLLLSGLLDLLSWILDLFEWRRGGRIMGWRRWLILFRFTALFFLLASGAAWLLGH